MPELPEVETVVRHLRPRLAGRTIRRFEASWPKVTAPAPVKTVAGQLANRQIVEVARRGKFILLELDRGLVHIHLRMTGRLLLAPTDAPLGPHDRARFCLSGDDDLVFRDMRKFGRIGYLQDRSTLEAQLGPEPLDEVFTGDLLATLLKGHKRQIKPLLLDQSFIAGLGNIYVDEALFAARIHPRALSHRVSRAKAHALHSAIREILAGSIAAQGTTFINFTWGADETGGYRMALKVFGRQGQPCPVCGTALVKQWIGQRGTHFCPRCQRKG